MSLRYIDIACDPEELSALCGAYNQLQTLLLATETNDTFSSYSNMTVVEFLLQ